MKKNKSFLPVLLLMMVIIGGYSYSAKSQVQDKWSGTASFLEKKSGGEILFHEWRLDATITNNKGRASQRMKIENTGASFDCNGDADTELDLGIDEETKTYGIRIFIPACKGLSTNKADGFTSPIAQDVTDIVIEGQPLGGNPNVLSGTLVDSYGPDASGVKTITTFKWYLARSADAVLIVTPSDYDNWLPEPGPDESATGSVMNIDLKVQGNNGQKTSLQAKSFVLRLSNTSKEPGITLNFPLNPSAPLLPDLRFLPQADGQISEQDQLIIFPCKDGETGRANIAAFDGGGWGTLTAVAILENGARIQGSLLFPGGTQEILIPKRKNASSKIATVWLGANGDPDETDDLESSAGNKKIGDGLTAYEEYRGVISEGKFRRLDPHEKELGVWLKRAELPLFSDGLSWFENASNLKVIRFYENEIGQNRRLNKNASSAHGYDQYALKLVKGIISKKGVVGKAFGGPQIPEKVTIIKIDYDKLVRLQRETEQEARRLNLVLPWTLDELLAKNVAHELGHGVNVRHHGESDILSIAMNADTYNPNLRIFSAPPNTEIIIRPYPLGGTVGKSGSGNQESGDIFCVMNYNPCYTWAVQETGTSSYFFYRVPLLPVGNLMCISKDGTDINTRDSNGHNNYFGDAAVGNCLDQIKLKN